MSLAPDPVPALLEAVSEAATAFAGACAGRLTLPVGGAHADVLALAFPPATAISFFATPHFPSVPPAALLKAANAPPRFLPLAWPDDGSPAEKLIAALSAFIASSETYELAYGFDP